MHVYQHSPCGLQIDIVSLVRDCPKIRRVARVLWRVSGGSRDVRGMRAGRQSLGGVDVSYVSYDGLIFDRSGVMC
jgi:hypothetical protein